MTFGRYLLQEVVTHVAMGPMDPGSPEDCREAEAYPHELGIVHGQEMVFRPGAQKGVYMRPDDTMTPKSGLLPCMIYFHIVLSGKSCAPGCWHAAHCMLLKGS